MNAPLRNSIGVIAILATLFSACNRGTPMALEKEDPNNLFRPSPYTSVPGSELGTGTSTSPIAVGSSPDGSLTASDRKALNSLNAEMENIIPTEQEDSPLSAALQAQLNQILEGQRRGLDMSAQKLQILPAIMEECGKKVAQLAPQAGQPMLGAWYGKACDTQVTTGKKKKKKTETKPGPEMPFKVVDPYAQDGLRPLDAPRIYQTVGLTGKLQADERGNGGIVTNSPWVCNVSDSGLNGRAAGGFCENPKYNQVEGGFQKCTMQIGLKTSENPIPENYVTAARVLTSCLRKGLYLVSPLFDQMVGNMDPNLANFIKMQMLGQQDSQ